jgi:hypothetical protein
MRLLVHTPWPPVPFATLLAQRENFTVHPFPGALAVMDVRSGGIPARKPSLLVAQGVMAHHGIHDGPDFLQKW